MQKLFSPSKHWKSSHNQKINLQHKKKNNYKTLFSFLMWKWNKMHCIYVFRCGFDCIKRTNENYDKTNKAKHQLWKLQKQKRFLKVFGSFSFIQATSRSMDDHRTNHIIYVRAHTHKMCSVCACAAIEFVLDLFHPTID